MSENLIHPTAIIADGATIGEGTRIGPYCVIGKHVILGSNNVVHSHVVLDGHTTIGSENQIYQFASVGAAPQDLKYRGEPSTLTIGDKNIIREYVTLQPGTEGGGMKTTIGDQNLFMVYCHVGHDCIIGSRNILANSATIAGHVEIGNATLLGGLVGVHQFVKIGDYSMVAAGSMVNKDIPPFLMCQGDRAALIGVHQIGLERNGFNDADIRGLKSAYRDIFLSREGSFQERIAKIAGGDTDIELSEHVSRLCTFIQESERGIAAIRRK